jgi:hypothetical protein
LNALYCAPSVEEHITLANHEHRRDAYCSKRVIREQAWKLRPPNGGGLSEQRKLDKARQILQAAFILKAHAKQKRLSSAPRAQEHERQNLCDRAAANRDNAGWSQSRKGTDFSRMTDSEIKRKPPAQGPAAYRRLS